MGVALVGTAQDLQFLDFADPTVGQIIPIVIVEACIFGCRAHAYSASKKSLWIFHLRL